MLRLIYVQKCAQVFFGKTPGLGTTLYAYKRACAHCRHIYIYTWYIRTCVCVCPPLEKGLLSPFPSSRGTVYPTEVTVQRRGFCGGTDISSGRGTDVPAFNTLTPMVHPVAVSLFPWSFMLPPPNRFPTAAFSRRSSAALLQMSEQIVKHFSCADLFTLRFPHLPSQRDTCIN